MLARTHVHGVHRARSAPHSHPLASPARSARASPSRRLVEQSALTRKRRKTVRGAAGTPRGTLHAQRTLRRLPGDSSSEARADPVPGPPLLSPQSCDLSLHGTRGGSHSLWPLYLGHTAHSHAPRPTKSLRSAPDSPSARPPLPSLRSAAIRAGPVRRAAQRIGFESGRALNGRVLTVQTK